jgi:transcriptional regulator GlxA family with amidase domain
VLRGAAARGAPFDVQLFAADAGATSIAAAHGLAVTVPGGDLEAARPDWVVVPGGGWADRAARGTWAEIRRGALPARLRDLHAGGASMASVCTGAMLLSAAGLTRGRPATTHHLARAALADEGAHVVDARVADDGDLVTAGGVTSGIDLALWLVERLASPALASQVARNLEHARTYDVHRGPRWSRTLA